MRVFAPRRIVGVGIDRVWLDRIYANGFPLDGEWRDVPDYFVQVSSGLPINDVTHAKLVDRCELSYSTFSGVYHHSRWGDCLYTQSDVCATGTSINRMGHGFVNYVGYETHEDKVIFEPSPNYKGKNRKRKEKIVRRRTNKPFSFSVSGCAWSKDGLPKGHGYNIVLPHYPVEFDQSGRYVLCSQISFNVTNYGAGVVVVGARQEILDLVQSLGVLACVPRYLNPNPKGYITEEEVVPYTEECLHNMTLWIARNYEKLANCPYNNQLRYRPEELKQVDAFPEYNPRDGYVLDEDYVFAERVEPMFRGRSGGLKAYWRNYLTEHALLEACESLPRLNDNSIQNLIEIVGFIKALVVDHRIDIPKSLADAWLAYRYTYGTGKSDIEEAIKFVHRRMDLGTLDRVIVGRGTSRTELDGTSIVCRCSVSVKPKNVDYLHKIWRALDTYGLTPDFYVIWDSIPYSFMVDWFLPIGDMLGVEDVNTMYFSGEYYTLSDICWSLTYTRVVGPLKIHCYTRWLGSVPSSLHSRYWFEPPSASNKTVTKRVLDAASIFIGR